MKLNKFDPAKKVAIIKEIKSLVEGMNLVQAKKFVESAPAVVKADIAKDEAEKLSGLWETQPWQRVDIMNVDEAEMLEGGGSLTGIGLKAEEWLGSGVGRWGVARGGS